MRPEVAAFCRRLRFDLADAEDLAQETMLVGLQHARAGRNPESWLGWLCGIARMLAKSAKTAVASLDELVAEPVADDDPLDSLLERERGQLLDIALARLDSPTRSLLTARYLDGEPVSELAERLAISENTASQRLVRARKSLLDSLTDHAPEAARAHGLLTSEEADGWTPTGIFCPRCGSTKLHGQRNDGFKLLCPTCDVNRQRQGLLGLSTAAQPLHAPTVLGGAAGFRVGLKRVNGWWDDYLRAGLRSGSVRCRGCGRQVSVRTRAPRSGASGFYTDCPCGTEFYVHPAGLLLHDAAGQNFWRDESKIRFVPEKRVRIGGRDAVVVAFESKMSSARLEAAYATDDLSALSLSARTINVRR